MRTLLWLLIIFPFIALSQGNDVYYNEKELKFQEEIFSSDIATVQLHPENFELGPAIIHLNSDEKLMLSFDDLSLERRNLYFTAVHCDASWNPSNISFADYIDGFIDNQIYDYVNSFNTLTRYTHYKQVLPNDQFRLKISGNYILKVYEDADQEKILFIKRFLVVEERVAIAPYFRPSSNISERRYRQEIDFNLNITGIQVIDPFNDIIPVIVQNDNWKITSGRLTPQFIRENELIYDLDDPNIFDGGNEFRKLDLKTMRLRSETVEEIVKDDQYRVKLLADEPRNFKRYIFDNDINGKYVIRNQDGSDPARDAEYCEVRFFLPYPTPLATGNLYIISSFTNWSYDNRYKLKYDESRKGYTLNCWLKQGYYNYLYGFVKDKTSYPDFSTIEGNWADAENNYTILIYIRTTDKRYDQLVGFKRFNTLINR